MPTPFMHLHMAERILACEALSPGLRDALREAWPAFYFGNVAPDYQAICNIRRELTHFYTLPPDRTMQPYDRMWRQYPQLARPDGLPAQQAAFIAGYAAHLLLDMVWLDDVVMPLFARSTRWADHGERRIVHFILLTYLDKIAFEALPETAGQSLAAAQVKRWLPFADDADLQRWQELLVKQLMPGGMLQTVMIYADRVGLSPDAFQSRLEDDRWMQRELFGKVPVDQVAQLIQESMDGTITLLERYYGNQVALEAESE